MEHGSGKRKTHLQGVSGFSRQTLRTIDRTKFLNQITRIGFEKYSQSQDYSKVIRKSRES